MLSHSLNSFSGFQLGSSSSGLQQFRHVPPQPAHHGSSSWMPGRTNYAPRTGLYRWTRERPESFNFYRVCLLKPETSRLNQIINLCSLNCCCWCCWMLNVLETRNNDVCWMLKLRFRNKFVLPYMLLLKISPPTKEYFVCGDQVKIVSVLGSDLLNPQDTDIVLTICVCSILRLMKYTFFLEFFKLWWHY